MQHSEYIKEKKYSPNTIQIFFPSLNQELFGFSIYFEETKNLCHKSNAFLEMPTLELKKGEKIWRISSSLGFKKAEDVVYDGM